MNFLSQAGLWFQSFIKPLLDLLKMPGVGPLLALLILITGTVIIAWAQHKYNKYSKELEAAVQILGKFKDEKEFYQNYSSIEAHFEKSKNLSNIWKEFAETLIHPTAYEQEDPKIRNTLRPSHFFDTHSANFLTPVISLMPNIFVGLGLFFTFAGLIAALTTAVEGMSGNTTDMQANLEALLLTTSAKFYTSLVALGVSIIMTIQLKFQDNKIDSLFRSLNDEIEKGMLYVSVEEISFHQLLELKEQKLQLQQFNTDLAMKLGEHIQTAVSSAMEPVVDKLSDMGGNLGQNNLDAMKEIGNTIAKNVQGAAGESLGHLSDRLDMLTTVLGDMAPNLSKSTVQFENDISSAFDNMKAAMALLAQDLQNNASQTSDMLNKKLETLADSLSVAANNIKSNLEQGASHVSTELESAITRLTIATEQSAEKMGHAVDGIKEAVSTISTSMENASNSAGHLAKVKMEEAGEKAAAEFSAAGTSMSKALEVSLTDLSSNIKGFEDSLYRTAGSLDNINTGLASSSIAVVKANQGLDTSIDSLREASSNVNSAIQPALAAVQNIQAAVRQMDDKVIISANLMGSAVSRLEEQLKTTSQMWQTHSQKFEGVNESLGEVFTKVNSQIVESLSHMSTFVVEVDGHFRSATAALQEAVEELADERKSGKV